VTARGTEILPVSPRSVETVVRLRDDRREHLALGAGEARGTLHRGEIEPDAAMESLVVEALDLEDLIDASRALDRGVVLLLQGTLGVAGVDLLDVGHGAIHSQDGHEDQARDRREPCPAHRNVASTVMPPGPLRSVP